MWSEQLRKWRSKRQKRKSGLRHSRGVRKAVTIWVRVFGGTDGKGEFWRIDRWSGKLLFSGNPVFSCMTLMCDLYVNWAGSKGFILIVIKFWLLPPNFFKWSFLANCHKTAMGIPGGPPSCSASHAEIIYECMFPWSGTKTSVILHHSSEWWFTNLTAIWAHNL